MIFIFQLFLAVLKEAREAPLEMIKSQKFDSERMALYPNLDYKQLYNALTQLMDVIPLIHIGLQGTLVLLYYYKKYNHFIPILS